MCAQWLKAQGLEKVGLFWEAGLVRQGLRRLLPRHRAPARPHGHPRGEARAEPASACSDDLRDRCASSASRASTTAATATPRSTSPTALKALDWDPPRVMGTAFMFYSNSNKWAEGLEGWHGVDQLGEDGTNPNYNAMIERFEKRFGRKTAQRRRRPGLRHGPRRHPRHRQRRHPRAQVRQGGHGAHPLDAGHQRRPRHATSSSGRGTARATRATSSPSASCAAASCASTATTDPSGPRTRPGTHRRAIRADERQGLHPRVHRHHRAQPRPLHAPHDGQLVPGRPRRAQPAVLRRVGHGRLDRPLARGREHVGARRLGRAGRATSPTSSRHADPAGSVAGRVVGGRPRRCAEAASTASSCPSRGPAASSSSAPTACAARCTPTSSSPCRRARPAALLDAIGEIGRPAIEALGLELVGAYRVAMVERLRGHRDLGHPGLGDVGRVRAGVRRTVAPCPSGGATLIGLERALAAPAAGRRAAGPLRIGRQPEESDRRPLEEL